MKIENPYKPGDRVWTYSIIHEHEKVVGTVTRVRGEAVEIMPDQYVKQPIFRQADQVWRTVTRDDERRR